MEREGGQQSTVVSSTVTGNQASVENPTQQRKSLCKYYS